MLNMALNKSSLHAHYCLFACLQHKLKYHEYCFKGKPVYLNLVFGVHKFKNILHKAVKGNHLSHLN